MQDFFVNLGMSFLQVRSIFIAALLLMSCNHAEPKSVIPQNHAIPMEYKIIWHWVDEFSFDEQEKLKNWLREITKVTRATIGVYQFDVHYYFHLSDGNEPVPYAHTARHHNQQAVHFYVNPKFTLQDFMNDWTAQHEISHLSFPFIDRKNMWFSEGYATYMSRKIMVSQGIFNTAEFEAIYLNKIGNDPNLYQFSGVTVPELADSLRARHQYPSIYYLGSSFFFLIDDKLQQDYGTNLAAVVSSYQKAGRLKDETLNEVLCSLDCIINSTLFIDLYNDYQTLPSEELLKYFKQNKAMY